MENILDKISSFKDYILGLGETSVTLIVGLLAYKVASNSNKYNSARERLEKAYYPLFISIEPYLYKNINLDDWNKFLYEFELIDSKYPLFIDPHLRDMIKSSTEIFSKGYEKGYIYKKDIKESTDIVCRLIADEYDKLCKLSHMPKRNYYYIIDKKQFKSIPHAIFIFIRAFGFPTLICILLYIFIFYGI